VSDYLSDKEQWEQIRVWIRDNAPWVAAGVGVAIVGVGAFRWWHSYLDERGVRAGALYTQMITALERNDRSGAFARLGELEREYPSSAYADQGKLLAARLFVEENELDKAAHELAAVTDSKDHALALVARMRLARVELSQGKPDEAITTLNATDPGAFAARYHAVRGDAYFAKGDKAAALKEYQSARSSVDPGDSALLDLKIADLTAAVPPAAPASAPAGSPAASPAK
jgi:predicted negative regulator of RcsB-dependent stress response